MREILLPLFSCQMLLFASCAEPPESPPERLRLATTTSTRDSGLLDALLPTFEREHHVRVDVIAVGTGQALKLGESGDADVLLVHAREAEDAFMQAGHGARRADVMDNMFEIVGPAGDLLGLSVLSAVDALQEIAEHEAIFVSRGDGSGTHLREQQLWQAGGGRPDWVEYIETGQGMGATLIVANELNGYTLVDRGTRLRFRDKIDLAPLVTEGDELKNPYGVIVVGGKQRPAIKSRLANALVDYLIAPETQRRIAEFRAGGEQLFYPAHLPEPAGR